MKRVVYALILVLTVAGAWLWQAQGQSEAEVSAEAGAVFSQQRCEEQGGTWRQFYSGCADYCYRQGETYSCSRDTPMACDCGQGVCMDKASGLCVECPTCVENNPAWSKDALPLGSQ